MSQRAAQLMLFCYNICLYSHLIISLNRFSAIFHPLSYSQLFSRSLTLGYIVLSWALAAVHILVHILCEETLTGFVQMVATSSTKISTGAFSSSKTNSVLQSPSTGTFSATAL